MSTMTVGELKGILEDLDDDIEVRFASQPSWPFEYSLSAAEAVDILGDENADDGDLELDQNQDTMDSDDYPSAPKMQEILYLVEGEQIGYLPGIVSQRIGWR
jgi:hypothetical protein